jgi:hypothetical protein
MGAARQLTQNYAGHLLQTITFRLEDKPWLERNLEATRAFLGGLGRPDASVPSRYVWDAVQARSVIDFLAHYSIDPRSSFLDGAAIRQYIDRQTQQDELIRWKVAVISQRTASNEENIGIVGTPRINTITRTRQETNLRSIGVLINPATATGEIGVGDEEIGLSREQIQQARTVFSTGRFRTFGQALRAQRDRREGLLLLYAISKNSVPRTGSELRRPLFDDPEHDGCTVIGAALVFPASDTASTIEYIVGSVGEWQDTEE